MLSSGSLHLLRLTHLYLRYLYCNSYWYRWLFIRKPQDATCEICTFKLPRFKTCFIRCISTCNLDQLEKIQIGTKGFCLITFSLSDSCSFSLSAQLHMLVSNLTYQAGSKTFCLLPCASWNQKIPPLDSFSFCKNLKNLYWCLEGTQSIGVLNVNIFQS